MKKNTSKKTVSAQKETVKKPVIAEIHSDSCKRCFNPWSLSIYVYWFIILFFIASTFYILGRSHNVLNAPANNVEITEEALIQPSGYYESGKKKLLAGNLEEAIADLTAAIDANNTDVNVYILRGEAYMQAGAYRDALNDFTNAIDMDAGNAVAYYDRALLNIRLEDYNAALADINSALAAQASNPSAALQMRDLYAKRGQLNLWLKNWDGAIADYTNSLTRPEGSVNPSVYSERAEAYTATGNWGDAINDYQSAVRVISEQIQGATTTEERETLSNRAMSYFEKSAALNLQLGNIDAARSDLNSAYTISTALGDAETTARLQGLIDELPQVQ